jgi:NAD-dependent SIR2 family protein deacetylase
MNAAISLAASWIEKAEGLLVTAGAGIGVDSGLPDFRGTEGFWQAYPGLAAQKIAFQDIANPKAFRTNPRQAWGFYGHRLDLYRQTSPHRGFSLLKKWADAKPNSVGVYTSNVDGHFQHEGFTNVVECHGSINTLQCIDNCKGITWDADSVHPEISTVGLMTSELPTCPHCGSLARPNIMMFNDWDFCDRPYAKPLFDLKYRIKNSPNLVIIEIGAGPAISTVRNFGSKFTHQGQVPRHKLIRINPREYSVSNDHQIGLSGNSLEVLEHLDFMLEL